MLPLYALNIDKKKITHHSNRVRQTKKEFFRGITATLNFLSGDVFFLLVSIQQIFITAYTMGERKNVIPVFKGAKITHETLKYNPNSTSVL